MTEYQDNQHVNEESLSDFNDDSRDERTAKMVKGSVWMTVGSFVSRLMGAIYVIPWYAWFGSEARLANNLMGKGYNIYSLFLMIATAGIPAAIAKHISHYNSLNEYKLSSKLFKRSLTVMLGFGFLFGAVLFFGAPIFAAGNKDLIPVIRSLSPAVLIFPVTSVLRGFFQGYHDMMPSALSQIVEQFVRVVYMLSATYIVMKVLQRNYVEAVTFSTFAAFVGMAAALIMLAFFYMRYTPVLREKEEHSSDAISISTNELIKSMLIEAGPFIIIGSSITLFKLIDQYSFEWMLGSFTNFSQDQLESLFTLVAVNPDKLTMLIISLATAMSATSLPLITEAYTIRDRNGLSKLVGNNIQLFFFVMLPASVGMIILAEPFNTLFYGHDTLGTRILIESCIVAIVLGLYTLVSTMLQGINRNAETVKYLIIGLLFKLALQYPMIYIFESYGPQIATGVGLLVSSLLILDSLYHYTQFDLSLLNKRGLLIIILTGIMALFAVVTKHLLYISLNPERRFQSVLIIIIVAVVGGVIYGYFALKTRLAERLLGDKAESLQKKLHIK